jgi:hypothetical protein
MQRPASFVVLERVDGHVVVAAKVPQWLWSDAANAAAPADVTRLRQTLTQKNLHHCLEQV